MMVLAVVVPGRGAASDDESVAALVERIRAAVTIVEGEAARSYTGWDGSDSSTIRTYTPLRIESVLKGSVSSRDIVLRQPGGEVAGIRALGAVGAEFDPGERLIVFVDQPDPIDGSYDIPAGPEGVYRITRDATGVDAIALRLGADARAYSSKEKAPGTLLMRVSLKRFEQFARGESPEGPERRGAIDTPSRVMQEAVRAPGSAANGESASAWHWVGGLAGMLAIVIVVRRLTRNR